MLRSTLGRSERAALAASREPARQLGDGCSRPPAAAVPAVDVIPRLLDPGPTPLPPESKGNGLRLAGEPSLG